MKHFNYYENQRGHPGLPSAACRCDHVIAMATTTFSLFSMCDEVSVFGVRVLEEVAELDRVTIIVNNLSLDAVVHPFTQERKQQRKWRTRKEPVVFLY